MDEHGATVGAGDFTAQVWKGFENIGLALAEVGLTFGSAVKLTFFLTDFAHLGQMRAVRDEFVNAVQMAALVHPERLIEVEVVAVAP